MSFIEHGIIAHRGGAATAPENTIAGFRQAAEQGIKWVETDTSLLRDNALILCHDASVDRCSDGEGSLRDLTGPEITALDAGSWFSDAFRGETFPFLDQALREMSELGLGLNLEFKIHGGERSELIPRMMTCLQDNWTDPDRLVISSFDWPGLHIVRKLDPNVRIGLLMHPLEENWLSTARELNAFSIHADHRRISEDDVKAVKHEGLQLYLFTPNDPEAVSQCWDWGIDAVITDRPADFLSWQQHPQARMASG